MLRTASSTLWHQLVHNYPNISAERIWSIIEEDLPVLLREIHAVLAELS